MVWRARVPPRRASRRRRAACTVRETARRQVHSDVFVARASKRQTTDDTAWLARSVREVWHGTSQCRHTTAAASAGAQHGAMAAPSSRPFVVSATVGVRRAMTVLLSLLPPPRAPSSLSPSQRPPSPSSSSMCKTDALARRRHRVAPLSLRHMKRRTVVTNSSRHVGHDVRRALRHTCRRGVPARHERVPRRDDVRHGALVQPALAPFGHPFVAAVVPRRRRRRRRRLDGGGARRHDGGGLGRRLHAVVVVGAVVVVAALVPTDLTACLLASVLCAA